MKKYLPNSPNIDLLICVMVPERRYFPFQLRELTKMGSKTLCYTRELAQDYNLIRREHLFGRLYTYTLTEKGKAYRNRLFGKDLLVGMVDTRNFFKNIETSNWRQQLSLNRRQRCIEKHGLNPKTPLYDNRKRQDLLRQSTEET